MTRRRETETERTARVIEIAVTVAKIEAAQMAYAKEWFSPTSSLPSRLAKQAVIDELQSHLKQIQVGALVTYPRQLRVSA